MRRISAMATLSTPFIAKKSSITVPGKALIASKPNMSPDQAAAILVGLVAGT